MHIFTPDDLVQYLYDETSLERSAQIEAALETNWSLKEIFNALSSAKQKLDTVKFSPREEAINNILHHAENTMSQLHH